MNSKNDPLRILATLQKQNELIYSYWLFRLQGYIVIKHVDMIFRLNSYETIAANSRHTANRVIKWKANLNKNLDKDT